MKKEKRMTIKPTQVIERPITAGARFAMIETQALQGLQGLIKRAPNAARLLVCLVQLMRPGTGGVVIASRVTMHELLNVSLPTVDRALKVLMDEGWVQRLRIGGAPALAINSRVAWVGPRGELQHAVFDATVIASREEQDAIALEPPPLRKVPIIASGENLLPVGPDLDPPSQPELPGVEYAAIPVPEDHMPSESSTSVDPETGEILCASSRQNLKPKKKTSKKVTSEA